MKSLVKLLRCLHPLLLVSVGAAVANRLLRNQGGPCPSPLILIFAPISLGIAIGIMLTLWRVFVWVMDVRGRKDDLL